MIIKDTASPVYVHNYYCRKKPLTEAKKLRSSTEVVLCWKKTLFLLCAKQTDVNLFILFCFYFKPTKIIKRELTKLDKKTYIIVSYCL